MAEPRTANEDVTAALFAQFLTSHAEVHRLEKEVRQEQWKGHLEAHRLLAEQLTAVAEELKRRLAEMNEFRAEAIKDKAQYAQVQVVNQQIVTLETAIKTVEEAIQDLEDWRNRGTGAEGQTTQDRTRFNDLRGALIGAAGVGVGIGAIVVAVVQSA